MSGIRDTVIETIFSRSLMGTGTQDFPIILMVSGGSDSTAMCRLASDFADEGLLKRELITVLHIDHGLRGCESMKDARFVELLSEELGFAFELRFVNVLSRLEEFGLNVEAAGRHLRYSAANELADSLEDSLTDSLADSQGASTQNARIWTAHTKDDRVENFFMRSIFGTGPGGLSSLKYKNERVIRPLLDTNREELRDFLKSERKSILLSGETFLWREDATNDDTRAFRAFVRKEIVPKAKERNPRLLDTLTSTINLLSDENDYLDKETKRVETFARIKGDDECEVALDIGKLDGIELPILRRLIHSAAKSVLPDEERIEKKHIDTIVSSMGRAGFSANLPGAAFVKSEYGALKFFSPEIAAENASSDDVLDFDAIHLEVPGSTSIGRNLKIMASIHQCGDGDGGGGKDGGGKGKGGEAGDPLAAERFVKEHASKQKICLDAVRLRHAFGGAPMVLDITRRREGDILCPLGMGGSHKKLSDILIDAKISRNKRDDILIFRALTNIVWVCGITLDERFAVSAETTEIVCISVQDEAL